MPETVEIKRSDERSAMDAPSILTKMAKHVYVRRFSHSDEGNEPEGSLNTSTKKNSDQKTDPTE